MKTGIATKALEKAVNLLKLGGLMVLHTTKDQIPGIDILPILKWLSKAIVYIRLKIYRHKKHWSHPAWWNSRDPYPYPPPPGKPSDRDWWWYGDRNDQRKQKGYWHQGKWVPLDVANNIQEQLGKEVEQLRTQMSKRETELQQYLQEMKQKAADAENERAETITNIQHIKEQMKDSERASEIKDHEYIYRQMLNDKKEKEQLIMKRTEQLPEVTRMPKIERVEFELPEKPSAKYDNKNKIPKNLRFVNENSKDSVDKMQTTVKIFDPESHSDYLNQVNSRRIDDLKTLDSNNEPGHDKLSEFLDRESSAAKIKIDSGDIKSYLLNDDLLKEEDAFQVRSSDYETPLKVAERYKDFPSIEDIVGQADRNGEPISQKLIIRSYKERNQ